MKVMTIVGTRPELIKLSCVIRQLDKHTSHILVHTGQNYDYELNQVFFEQLEIRQPDYFLEAVGNNAAQTIARVIERSDEIIEKVQPDAILVYGDTNSCLSVISAKRRKVPVFHMEAGNRCFDDRVPEEINRRIVDHLSDVNMTLTEHARRYLIAEGIRAEMVLKVGSSMKEVLSRHAEQIDHSDVLKRLGLLPGTFFIVSAHREENIDSDKNLKRFIETLNQLAVTYEKRVIVSTHPRTRKRLDALADLKINKLVEFSKPFGFFDYIALQKAAFCVVSDSGTITEEASILGFPAVTIREAHERPEGMDQGSLIMCGLRPSDVVDAVRVVTQQQAESGTLIRVVPDYDVESVSHKVVRIILSYTNYVNQNVWTKEAP